MTSQNAPQARRANTGKKGILFTFAAMIRNEAQCRIQPFSEVIIFSLSPSPCSLRLFYTHRAT